MKKFRIPLRVVFYREGSDWVAHCLEFDLMGDGVTQSIAIGRLTAAIAMQVEATLEYSNLENLFKPADPRFHLMFAAGSNTAGGEVRIHIDSVVIDESEAREYLETGSLDEAELALS